MDKKSFDIVLDEIRKVSRVLFFKIKNSYMIVLVKSMEILDLWILWCSVS